MSDEAFLREAIALAVESVRAGGGPFGAVVVSEGRVIGRGTNRVVPDADPTAHAEVQAIREAARTLGSHVLAGATIYASCEPCPMCYGAIRWARIDRLVYAAHGDDAAHAGFDDERIREELARPDAARSLEIDSALRDEGLAPFAAWDAAADRTPY